MSALLGALLDALPALMFAAVGAVFSERGGVVNVGVEGMMRAGAFSAAAFSVLLPTPVGVLLGALAGVLTAALHAWLSVRLRSDQVVSGMAINLVMLALGTFLLEALFDSPSTTPAIAPLGLYGGHTLFTWSALVLPFAAHAVLQWTPWGLRLRAVGEKPQAVAAMGVRVARVRVSGVLVSGALAGLGGAALSTATLDRFEHHMPSGLGFVAVAAMVFGRWTPLGAGAAAVFFALGDAVRVRLATSLPELPKGVLLALPYVLTLVVLAAQGRKQTAPAALGVPYDPELR